MPACLSEYRCMQCKKLLFKGFLVEGSVEVKCKHCHAITNVVASQYNKLLCMIDPCPNRIPHAPEK